MVLPTSRRSCLRILQGDQTLVTKSGKVNILRRMRDRPRTRFAAALASVTLAACSLGVPAALSGASSPAVRGTGDLTGAVLDCSTDTVTLSGSYHYSEIGSVHQLANGTWFSQGSLSFNLNGVVGTGSSGTSYRVVGATHLGYAFFFGSASPGIDVEQTVETWHLVPSDGGVPLSFREHFAFVVTPSGSTIVADQGPSDCT